MSWSRNNAGSFVFTGPVPAAEILAVAETITAEAFYRETILISPAAVREYLKQKLALREHEVFVLVLLDQRHRVIAYREMFRGTIDGASVHPREVVKEALAHNAAAAFIAHNHPSGNPEPSSADIAVTRRLIDALQLIDVRLLDHFVVGGTETTSFAERGLM